MSDSDRVRWRSRRGMLELDLVLSRFLDRHWDRLDSGLRSDYLRLLEYPDAELWDIIAGKGELRSGDGVLLELIRMD